jgi:hypothetical protein
MLGLWEDPVMSAGMGLAGARRAAAHFDVRTMVASYEALYDDVLKIRRTAAA